MFVLLVLTGVYIFHYAETGRNTIGGVEAENTVEDVNVAEKVVAIDRLFRIDSIPFCQNLTDQNLTVEEAALPPEAIMMPAALSEG